jgi:hypothetical protein
MVRTEKRNWCRPIRYGQGWDVVWPPRWRELGWGNGITSYYVREINFGIANSCRMFKKDTAKAVLG